MEYSIHEISQMFSLNASTLRYYEDLGLLTNVEKNASGRRVYKDCHVGRLRAICCFKNAGMTMQDLQKFFELEDEKGEHLPEMVEILVMRKEMMHEKIQEMLRDYNHLLRKVAYYSDSAKAKESGKPLPSWADYKHLEML